MNADTSRVVLITGCSSGIGKATALRLAKAGHTVWATARKMETLNDLASAGCKTLALDVTSEDSMQAAVKQIGPIDVLINNAGYSQSGALETVPVSALRKQFETNVFGPVRLAQLVLPSMRAKKSGRIINIGSMGGKLTFPGGGAYHASKYALEAISDALRFEVRGFGVDVVLIQPGLIRSGFSEAAVSAMSGEVADAYAAFNEHVATSTREVYEKGPLAKLGGDPDDVAKVVERAIRVKRPRARYTVTASASVLLFQRRMLPDGMWDAFLRSQFPEPTTALARRNS